jgi:hypothetical protein
VPSVQETISDLACQASPAVMREPESCSRSARTPSEGQARPAARATQTDVAVELMEVVAGQEKQPFTFGRRRSTHRQLFGIAVGPSMSTARFLRSRSGEGSNPAPAR